MKFRYRRFSIAGSVGVGALLLALWWRPVVQNKTVVLTSSGFEPRLVTVRVGERVTFISTRGTSFWPASNLHPSHLVYPEFDAKGPVSASAAYVFRFGSSGSWRYHDHLAPQFTGTVIVSTSWWEPLTGVVTNMLETWGIRADGHDCETVTEKNRYECWEREVRRLVKTDGIAPAFAYISERRGDADFQTICHDLTHVIGREVFLSRRWQGELPGAVDYRMCDYGFFHGYMELMIGTGDNLSRARSMCDSITAERNTGQLVASCYHGIGHGAVIAHELPGTTDPWQLVPQGVAVCEEASRDWGKRENCVSGVIDGLASLITGGQYPLTDAVRQHPFAICTTLDDHYGTACRMSFVGLTMYLSQGEIPAAVALIERDLQTSTLPLVHNVVSMMVRERKQPDLVQMLAECGRTPTALRRACTDGVLEGFFLARITDDTRAEDMVAICTVLPKQTEMNLCYREIVRQLYDWKGNAIAEQWCSALPTDFRSLCSIDVEMFIAEDGI